MSICTTTELATALGSGTLYSEADLQLVCDAADNVLVPMLWSNNYFNIAHSNTTNTGTLYFDFPVTEIFYVGQTITISGNGSKHNGSKTITAVGEKTITYAITGNNNTALPYHSVNPFGTVALESYVTYATIPAIREAALYIAVDIWIGRQQSVMGGMAVDGVPISYRPGALLLAKVRSLIAPYLAPGSMVG